MQDLVNQLRIDLPKKFAPLESKAIIDRGLSGMHLTTPPILLEGVKLDPKELAQTQIDLNRMLSQTPIEVKLKDKKQLRILALDLVVTSSGLVYLADLPDAEFF